MSQNKTVLVTGSSSGFGFLITETLLSQGHTVLATMRGLNGKNSGNANKLRELAAGKSGKLHLLDLDVTDDHSVETAVAEALKIVDSIDVLVNNAGYGGGGYAEGFTTDQWKQIFDVNVFGVQRVSRAVLPGMRKKGSGLIINISSVMGRIVLPFAAPYTASKYALEGMTESYRYELSGTGVDAVVVEPGGFGTNFLGNMAPAADEQRVASYGELANMPEQMWGGVGELLQTDAAPDPQDVADVVLKLIETPAGERPLRTVVDPMSGGEAPAAINQLTDQIQEQVLTGFGMPQLLSVKKADS